MKNAFLIVLILILGCQPNKPEIKSKELTQKVDTYKNIISGAGPTDCMIAFAIVFRKIWTGA